MHPSGRELWSKYCRLCGTDGCGGVEAGILLDPVKIVAQVLIYPFFLGSVPTQSEIRLANSYFFHKATCLLLWELFLPKEESSLRPPSSQPTGSRVGRSSSKTHASCAHCGSRTQLDERSSHCIFRGAPEGKCWCISLRLQRCWAQVCHPCHASHNPAGTRLCRGYCCMSRGIYLIPRAQILVLIVKIIG